MYKLIMNSIYGKTIEKLHDIDTNILKDCYTKNDNDNDTQEFTDDTSKFLRNNYFDIQ